MFRRLANVINKKKNINYFRMKKITEILLLLMWARQIGRKSQKKEKRILCRLK